jgi:hypothetical protein
MQESAFANEVRRFTLYTKIFWPLHRRLVRNKITPRCTRCIVSANYAPLNGAGLCHYCRDGISEFKKDQRDLKQMSADLHVLLDSYQGKGNGSHDALVLFSGGKDSCYLVDDLRSRYPGLRLLLITVDNTVMSPFALKNVTRVLKKLDFSHIQVRPPESLYTKMFRHAFLHLNEKGCSGTVDQFDGDFFHDVCRNWAVRLQIPLVISGCSQTQVERILGLSHFESPRWFEESKRVEVANIRLADVFTESEMEYWWDGTRWPKDKVPRVIYPFYAWNLAEDFIRSKVIGLELLDADMNHPLLTNNQLIPLMTMVDMAKYGYSSFEPEFSQMVRDGKADPIFWRNVFELSEYAAKSGHFVAASVDEMLERLDLTRQQLGLPVR